MRSVSPAKLTVLGLVLLLVCGEGLASLPPEVGPVLVIIGVSGVGALLLAAFRLIMRRTIAVRILILVVVGAVGFLGGTTVYGIAFVQDRTSADCSDAAHGPSREARAESLARARSDISGLPYVFAARVAPNPGVTLDCTVAEADLARFEKGVCPRYPSSEMPPCPCGASEFPRDAACGSMVCVEESGGLLLKCRY